MLPLETPAADRSSVRRATPVVFLAALVYFLCFHRYGFFLQDEGVNAYQALRVLDGQLPYGDFQTAYTPLGYYLHATLFRLFGVNLSVLRAAASLACAATAAILFVAAARVLPGFWAVLPSFLYVLLEDQDSRGFVVHTIAYPARYVSTLWGLSLCLVLAHARRPRRSLAVALGLVAAAILALKHTAGIYNAWAAGLALILVARAGDEPARAPAPLALLPPAFVLGIIAALPVLFGNLTSASLRSFFVFGVPVACAAAIVLVGMAGGGRRTLRTAGADLAWMGAGLVVPTLLWVAYFADVAGGHTLLQRLILDGPRVARSYSIAFPPPGTLALGAAVVVAVALGLRLSVARGMMARARGARILFASGALLAAIGLVPAAIVIRQSVQIEGFELAAMHFGRGLDNLAFYLVPVIAYAYLPGLVTFVRRGGPLDPALLCWVQAVCQLLLIYPRLDIAHLYEGTVTLLLVGTVLLHRTLRFFRTDAVIPRRLAWAVAVAVVLVTTAKMIPRVHAEIGWRSGPIVQHRMLLAGERGGGLYTTGPAGAWVPALNRAVATLHEETRPGEPIFAFPALPAIYFLTDRRNPTHLDYFYSGFGEGGDELLAVERLEREGVRWVAWMDDSVYDPPDRGYFPILRDYIHRHYRQVSFYPPFRILERVRP